MKKRLAAFAGTVRRFVRSMLAPKTQSLFHPDSPGARVEITRTRFGRWFKPADFATLDEMIKYHRANAQISGGTPSTESDCSAIQSKGD